MVGTEKATRGRQRCLSVVPVNMGHGLNPLQEAQEHPVALLSSAGRKGLFAESLPLQEAVFTLAAAAAAADTPAAAAAAAESVDFHVQSAPPRGVLLSLLLQQAPILGAELGKPSLPRVFVLIYIFL